MMKVEITSAKVHVDANFGRKGSVLAQTIEGWGDGFETHLEVESPEPPERVAGVLRNAENGCFVMQSLVKPSPVKTSAALNGQAIDLADYPPPIPD